MVQLWSDGPPVLLRHRPGEHKLQSACVCPPTAAKYLPAGQSVQFGTPVNVARPYFPRGHGLKQMQFVCALLLDMPSSHSVQVVCPNLPATVPSAQTLHWFIPAKGWN